jgi:dolichol-phosphate mannosyltransferase
MVEAIIKVKDRVRLIRVMNVEVGYRRKIIQFERAGQPKKRDRRVLLKKIFFSLEVLFSSSNNILQAANLLSLIISMVSFLYVIYAFAMYFFIPDVAEGWTSTSIVIATFFGVMFLVLGVIGGYVSVIHKETKKGPLYHISREVSTGELYDLFEERNVE